MTANGKRVALVAGLLAALLLAGVFWLVRTAIAPAGTDAGPQWRTPPAVSATPAASTRVPAPTTRAPAPTGGVRTTRLADGPRPPSSRPADPPRPPGPPRPARTVQANGPVRGGVIDDPCTGLANPFEVPAKVERLGFQRRDDGVAKDNPRCARTATTTYGDVFQGPCDSGVELAAGKSCWVGIGISAGRSARPGEPSEELDAIFEITLSAVCTSDAPAPCDLDRVKALKPTPQDPVTVVRTGACTDTCRVSVLRFREPPPAEESPSAAAS